MINRHITLPRLCLAAALLLGCALQQTYAAINLGTTRVIFEGKKREASIPAKNISDAPYLLQSWVDAGENKLQTPFFVNPPLSRLDPGKENILRVQRTSDDLPQDRESIFWFNVKEIPQKATEDNVLQIAIRTRLKLFYRPAGLKTTPTEAAESLKWTVVPGTAGQPPVLKVSNPSPYHITFSMVELMDGSARKDGVKQLDMIAPFSHLIYEIEHQKSAQPVRISYMTINDFGGATAHDDVTAAIDASDTVSAQERQAARDAIAAAAATPSLQPDQAPAIEAQGQANANAAQ